MTTAAAPARTPEGTGNRLLDLLPARELGLLRDRWEPVELPVGLELYRQRGPIPYVYFPTSGVTSQTVIARDGDEVEAATVGNEGMVGVAVMLGLDVSPARTIQQVPGNGLRIETHQFRRVLKSSSVLESLLRKYVAYAMRYADQTIACNLLHDVEERSCRWLLMAHDRVGQDVFPLTHEFLAEMLGVRRQSVTEVMRRLQSAGLVSYRRGIVRIVDRPGLERAACECHAVSRRFYEEIVGAEQERDGD